MPRRLAMTALLMMMPLVLAGCWDADDISNRGTPNAVSLDLGAAGQIKFGCSFHVPGSLLPPFNSTAQLFEKRNFTLYGEGRSLLDAWRDLQTRYTRDVYMGQISAIILSERFARSNLHHLLDFMNRRAEIPGDALVLVTKSDPKQLIDRRLENNFVPGTYILSYFQSVAKHSLAIPVKLWQLDAAFINGNSDAHLPLIEPSQGLYQIAGTALYSGTRWAGELSVAETQFLFLLFGDRYGYLTVPLGSGGLVAYFDVDSKTKIVPRMLKPDQFRFDIKIKASGSLRETYPKNLPVTLSEKRGYEQETAAFLRSKTLQLLAKLRRLNSDPVGFGKKARINYPKQWQTMDWHQTFPKSLFWVTVEFRFDDTGVPE
jgi:spore germination protein KC